MLRNKRCKIPNHVCEEILIAILVRLPGKSLVRFTGVSKSWESLIGSSDFVSIHIKNARKLGRSYVVAFHQTPRGSARNLYNSLFRNQTFEHCLELTLPSKIYITDFAIYGSCNGLLFISNRVLRWTSPVYIWNPYIRKIRTLPEPGIKQPRGSIPYEVRHSFGFNPEVNDYKVVRMLHYGPRMKGNAYVHRKEPKISFAVEVFSLSMHSWKRIETEFPSWLNSRWKYSGSEFLNGVAYWLIEKDSTFRIVSFDTASENFVDLVVQDTVYNSRLLPDVGLHINVYKESICLLNFKTDDRHLYKIHVDLWAVQEQSVTKLRTFDVSYWEHYKVRAYSFPLFFTTDNELLLQGRSSDSSKSGDMFLYNLESQEAMKTGIELAATQNYFFYADTYVESLVLLK